MTLRNLFLSVILGILGGCILIPSFNNYNVEVAIARGGDARYFEVRYPGFKGEKWNYDVERYKWLDKRAVYVAQEEDIPQDAVCTWIKFNGKTNSVIVLVKSQLPSSFRTLQDTLVFTLTPSNSVEFAVDIWCEQYRTRRVPVGTFQGHLKE